MKVEFSERQLQFMKQLDLPFKITDKLDEDQLFELENVVTEYLAFEGIDENEDVTSEGKICEEIIELLAK